MENVIIICALLVILVGAIVTLVRRSGRKGCCGSSGDYKPRKKKLQAVIAVKVFALDGMHCEKCANRVTEAVNDIPGVAGVVNLKKGSSPCPMNGRFPTGSSEPPSSGWVTP